MYVDIICKANTNQMDNSSSSSSSSDFDDFADFIMLYLLNEYDESLLKKYHEEYQS